MTDFEMSLRGKVIAITGAASGIGLQLSKLCAYKGAKLALADIQEEALDALVSEIKAGGIEVPTPGADPKAP